MAEKITIFYSYAAADEKLRERLGQHLTGLRNSGFIDEYGTHHVDHGDVLSKSITTDLQKAQIILLLVSHNSLGSKDLLYQEELKQILKQFHEGKSRIIPILLRPYYLKGTGYEDFESLPKNGRFVTEWPNKERAFDSIAQSLEELIKKLIKDNRLNDDNSKDDRSNDHSFVSFQSSSSRVNDSRHHRASVRDQIFISYSHKDKIWLDELQKILAPVIREKKIKIWEDTQIKAGEDWREQISVALSAAKAAILLVTPDFLASDFVAENEIPHLLENANKGGMVILWIAVRHSLYKETPIVKYQALNRPLKPLESLRRADRNKEWILIWEKIEQAINR